MKRYKNYENNKKKRRALKKQGYKNIKIKNGKVISKKHKDTPTWTTFLDNEEWVEDKRNTRADAYEEDYGTFEQEPDWEEYQKDSQADAEEPEDYRCYEYEPWR